MTDINQLCKSFLQTIQTTKNLSDKSISAYRSDLNDLQRYIVSYGADISQSLVLEYIQHLSQDRHLKDTTICRKLITLKMFFAYLYEQSYLPENYFKAVSFKFRKEKRLPKTLSVDDVQAMLQYASKHAGNVPARWKSVRDLALIDLLISTGIRIGEASNISVSDIILSERTILIHGKGRKQRLIYISCSQTWDNLLRWIDIRKNISKSDKLFINRYGEQLSIHGIEHIYGQIKEGAGIMGHSTPHYLRHTFATNILSNGADLRSVQELLGHASVATTEIYTEVSAKRKIEVLDKYNYRNSL